MRTSVQALILLSFIMVLPACRQAGKEADASIFRYNEPAGITSLDPAFARNLSNIWATHQIFNGLVQLDDQLEIQPCVADRWDISEDGLLYTFYLRNDVHFHHDELLSGSRGRKVRADDFVFSFNRIQDPATASPGAWVFQAVARDQNGMLDVKAIDDTTLQIRLSEPFPPFLGILSMPYCAVVLPEAVTRYGEDFRQHPVGTGPFRFKYWKEGMKLVLRKNPYYFETLNGKQLPFLEAVSITFVIDRQAAFLEFIKGNLDFMSGIDPSYKDELLTPEGKLRPKYEGQVILTMQPYLNTEYLGFLIEKGNPAVAASPYQDVRLRKAMNHGFDRQKMIRYLRNNIGTPGTGGFIPKGLPGYDSLSSIGYRYDPQLAERLLAEAGYPGGKGLPDISLVTSPEYLDICKYVQHQLNDIGIPMRIEVTPPAALKEMRAQARLPFYRGSWIADYPDAENYLSVFLSRNFSPQGPNYSRYASPEYDKLYHLAMKETNDRVRAAMYHQMDSLLMDASPVMILYYDMVLRFTSSRVAGLGSNPINMLSLKQVYKIKDPE